MMQTPDDDVRLISGSEAVSALRDSGFVSGWSDLHSRCEWSTIFQGPAFLSVWYDVYGARFSPVLACAGPEARPCGLLALAEERESGRLVVAGTHHAEYQAWLEAPDAGQQFLPSAIAKVQEQNPKSNLTFQYVPGNVPLESLVASGLQVTRTTHSRPLMRIDPDDVAKSISKKSNKSRLNRLKRSGPVTLDRVTQVSQFEELLDDLIWQYDLRQGAVNQSTPFFEDPLKRPFHSALMERSDLLHVTVLRVGETRVSIHVDYQDGSWSYLGIPAHSPYFHNHSPGKLHMLLLAQQMVSEGIECLDLTPGEDAWKERFANDHEDVYSITIHASRTSRLKRAVPVRLRQGANRILGAFGSSGQSVKSAIRRVPGVSMLSRDRAKNQAIAADHVLFHSTRVPESPDGLRAAMHAPADLLRTMPDERLHEKHQLLSESLKRLERGEELCTVVDDEHLQGVGWLANDLQSAELGTAEGVEYPGGRVAYVMSIAAQRHERIRRAILCAILLESTDDDPSVVIALDARAEGMQRLVDQFGLVPAAQRDHAVSVSEDTR